MNSMKHALRTDASLMMTNGHGSSTIIPFAKGTPIDVIAAVAQRIHEQSVRDSHDMYGRDIWVRPRLLSEVTHKQLAAQVSLKPVPALPRVSIHALSPRQKQVYARRHLSDVVIAQELGISSASVACYRADAQVRVQQIERATMTGH